MARDLRRRRADPDPVAAVVAAGAVVAILPMMENPPIQKEMEGNPHYLLTSAGDVENLEHTKEIHKKKHLIQFPISVNLEKVRKPSEGPCPTVLLKANTGVDVNLLKSTTFDRIIGDRLILQPSTYKMDAYRNSTVDVLGMFFTFLRLKGKIYRQLFFMTTANASPNLLSRDSCYTLGVLKTMLLGGNFENLEEFQYTAYNQLGATTRWMADHFNIGQMKELDKRSNFIPLSGLFTRIIFKATH